MLQFAVSVGVQVLQNATGEATVLTDAGHQHGLSSLRFAHHTVAVI